LENCREQKRQTNVGCIQILHPGLPDIAVDGDGRAPAAVGAPVSRRVIIHSSQCSQQVFAFLLRWMPSVFRTGARDKIGIFGKRFATFYITQTPEMTYIE
jgi:hypothetical protein